jgi:hypothetical protein
MQEHRCARLEMYWERINDEDDAQRSPNAPQDR